MPELNVKHMWTPSLQIQAITHTLSTDSANHKNPLNSPSQSETISLFLQSITNYLTAKSLKTQPPLLSGQI